MGFSDPERNHEWALRLLGVIERCPKVGYLLKKAFEYRDPRLRVGLFGLQFCSPVGLAAGFDKNCLVPRSLAGFGFSHIEVGTVTPLPQEGNPRPRIWKLGKDRAVINWMGMPNVGIEVLVENLKKVRERDFVLGVNIGKGTATALEEAWRDYALAFDRSHHYADYMAINVSCPNAPEFRRLQGKEFLDDLIGGIKSLGSAPPLLLKIDPDLSFPEIDDILTVAEAHRIAGIIATNTTVSRENLRSRYKDKPGGLSGLPLKERSTRIIGYIHQQTKGSLPIIGVGGIFRAEDALEKIKAGASLIQVYTGFVFDPLKGPFVVKNINRGLSRVLELEGAKSIGDLVGGG
jgi:dihydroorotate dehydrogenase